MAVIDSVLCLDASVICKSETLSVVAFDWSKIVTREHLYQSRHYLMLYNERQEDQVNHETADNCWRRVYFTFSNIIRFRHYVRLKLFDLNQTVTYVQYLATVL